MSQMFKILHFIYLLFDIIIVSTTLDKYTSFILYATRI